MPAQSSRASGSSPALKAGRLGASAGSSCCSLLSRLWMPRRSLKGRYSCWRQKAADRSASSWRLCIWDGVSASGSCGFSNLAISCSMNAALRSLVELWSGQSSPRMSRDTIKHPVELGRLCAPTCPAGPRLSREQVSAPRPRDEHLRRHIGLVRLTAVLPNWPLDN